MITCDERHGAHASEHRVLELTIASMSRLGERVILWCKVATAVIGFCTAVVVVYGTITAAYAKSALVTIVDDRMRAKADDRDAELERIARRAAHLASQLRKD